MIEKNLETDSQTENIAFIRIKEKELELKIKEKELEIKKIEADIEYAKSENKKFEAEQIKLKLQCSPKENFEMLKEEATILSLMECAPLFCKRKKSECFWIVQFAKKLNLDPVMVMNQIYFLHGKPAYSSSLMIAVINKCGQFSQLEFLYTGEGDDRTCIAQAWSKHSKILLKSIPISLKTAKEEGWARKGSKWLTMTDLMLQYRAAAFFCRAYASQYLNGHTKEEIEDINN